MTEKEKPKLFLWLDVETTGTDPDRDDILEIAAQLTYADYRLSRLGDPFHKLVYPQRTTSLFDVKPEVLEMHASNGLFRALQDVHKQGRFTDWASSFSQWARNYKLHDFDVQLAGRSVHFDRSFITPEMTKSNRILSLNLSHRHFDLSSVLTTIKICGIEPPEQTSNHRALEDVSLDIEMTRWIFNHFNVLTPSERAVPAA